MLIYKASGVFNFAQGTMVLFAALTLVGLLERGVPVAVALVLTTGVMIALAFAIERLVLRPLVNQAHIILFMATIGLNFFLEGFGEMVWGANVKRLDIGIPDKSFIVKGVQINELERRMGYSRRYLHALFLELGIGVMDAASKSEVEALLRDDPAVSGGRLRFEVFSAASFMRGEV